MRKSGDELGLGKLTFQVIRRTIRTLGQKIENTQGDPGSLEALAVIDVYISLLIQPA